MSTQFKIKVPQGARLIDSTQGGSKPNPKDFTTIATFRESTGCYQFRRDETSLEVKISSAINMGIVNMNKTKGKPKPVVLSSADHAVNGAVAVIAKATLEKVVLRCEPEYGMWLVASVVLSGKVKYRVANELMTTGTRNYWFESFSKANDMYSEVLSAGSWSEWVKEKG